MSYTLNHANNRTVLVILSLIILVIPTISVAHAQMVQTPDQPIGFTATPVSPTSINLNWSPPQNNGGTPITGYRIDYRIAPSSTYSTLITLNNVTTYTHTSLTTDKTYIYRVYAINAIGTGYPSIEMMSTPTGNSTSSIVSNQTNSIPSTSTQSQNQVATIQPIPQISQQEITSFFTDKTSYNIGNKIYFFGTTVDNDTYVTILIFDPTSKFVMLASAVAHNHAFQSVIDTSTSDNLQRFSFKGMYNATAFIANKNSGKTTSFTFSSDGYQPSYKIPSQNNEANIISEHTTSTITTTTDKSSYRMGDTIMISGTAASIVPDTPLTIQILDPNGITVRVAQIYVSQDGRYTDAIKVAGAVWKTSGIYTIQVQYGSSIARTTLTLSVPSSISALPPTTDTPTNSPDLSTKLHPLTPVTAPIPFGNSTTLKLVIVYNTSPIFDYELMRYNVAVNFEKIKSLVMGSENSTATIQNIMNILDKQILLLETEKQNVKQYESNGSLTIEYSNWQMEYSVTHYLESFPKGILIGMQHGMSLHDALNQDEQNIQHVFANYDVSDISTPISTTQSHVADTFTKNRSSQNTNFIEAKLSTNSISGKNLSLLDGEWVKYEISHIESFSTDPLLDAELKSLAVNSLAIRDNTGSIVSTTAFKTIINHVSGPNATIVYSIFFENGTEKQAPEIVFSLKNYHGVPIAIPLGLKKGETIPIGPNLEPLKVNGTKTLQIGNKKVEALELSSSIIKFMEGGSVETDYQVCYDENTGIMLTRSSNILLSAGNGVSAHASMTLNAVDMSDNILQPRPTLSSSAVINPTQQDIENINQAKNNQTIAAEINVRNDKTETTSIDNNVTVQTTNTTSDSLGVKVSAASQTGPKVIAFNLNATTINVSNLKDLGVIYDGKLISPAPNMDAILHAKSTDNPSFAIVVTQSGVQVLVLVPHFSTHTITLTNMSKVIPAVPEFGPIVGIITIISLIGSIIISRKFSIVTRVQ